MEKKEWIIRENGTIAERFTRERELAAEQPVMDALATNVFRNVAGLLNVLSWGAVHASMGPEDILWTVPIRRIPLKARFRFVNQVLVPMFGSSSDLEMPLEWQAPDDIRLAFAIRTEYDGGRHHIDNNWLFAFNQAGSGFKLPLPNLYDDCAVCMGDFVRAYDTAAQCVAASLEQFNQSQWNSDLMPPLEASQKFFRFRPTDEAFQTLPIDSADWTSLCAKVSTAVMDRVIS